MHLLSEMSRYHEIHLILHQGANELVGEVNGYKFPDSVHVYSTEDTPPPRNIFNRLPKRIGPGLEYRWLRRSWRGPADGTLLKCHHLLRRIIRTTNIDCVVFEHLSSMTMSVLARRWQRNIRCILDAHNVDYKLTKQAFEAQSQNGELRLHQIRTLEKLYWTESHLGDFAHSFWACSDEDRIYLESVNVIQGYTIPNGVDTEYFQFDQNEKKYLSPFLIFAASFDTTANLDGLNYLVDEIWPLIRKRNAVLRLLVVGCGITPATHDKLRSIPGVDTHGNVPDVRPYYRKAAVSLVPLRIGSGTRLKILESMSQGIPIVSTTRGAEGISAVSGQHLFLADNPADFSGNVIQLLSDQTLYQKIRKNARSFVEQTFDWKIIGRRLNEALTEVIEGKNENEKGYRSS